MRLKKNRKVLVSGASIAGPTVAYWLDRFGFEVAVVERAATIRLGGYPIDIRGSAVPVVERMGILSRLREAHINTTGLIFYAEDGTVIRNVPPEEINGDLEGYDIEVPRWTLSTLLYETAKDRVDYRFEESIRTIDERAEGVHVTFQSGAEEMFDIVIGADGLHSSTRRLAFGPEDQFLKYMGYTFAGFTMPNILDLSHSAALRPAVGRLVALYAVGHPERTHAFFNLSSDFPSDEELRSVEAQRALILREYGNDGWIVPQMLQFFETADDIYFDSVSQVHMPQWSKGRVALVGDAAYAPSFLTGQGSSLSLVGGYVLAGELARHEDHAEAFAAYERIARPYVKANQGIAEFRGSQFIPNNEHELQTFRTRIGEMEFGGDNDFAEGRRRVYNCLALPDYDAELAVA